MSQEDPDTYCLECGTYMSFEEMMWDLASCKACLVNSNYCIGCTAEARCPICEVCVAKEATQVEIETARSNLINAREYFRQKYAKWLSKKEVDTPYQCKYEMPCMCEPCIFSKGPELDLTTEADCHRLRMALHPYKTWFGSKGESPDCCETAEWYESWIAKTPKHLDPSAWKYHETHRLVWNARKLL